MSLIEGVYEGHAVKVLVDAEGRLVLSGGTSAARNGVGYSYEDKSTIVPNPKRNDTILELDTKNVYIHDGTRWVVF